MLIHQIWIGKYAPPTFWMHSVRRFSEQYGHTYVFWNEDAIGNLKLENRKHYELLYKEKRFAGASDILRYEILYQYGGIYIDADTVIMKPEHFRPVNIKNGHFGGTSQRLVHLPSSALRWMGVPIFNRITRS